MQLIVLPNSNGLTDKSTSELSANRTIKLSNPGMAIDILIVLFGGIFFSYIGTLPFGPINLSVVDTTLKQGRRPAIAMSITASLIEMVHVFIALRCSLVFSDLIFYSSWTRWVAVCILLAIGLYFFFKVEKPKEIPPTASSQRRGAITKGAVLAVLNPQAIPFWFFGLTSMDAAGVFSLAFQRNVPLLILFLLGTAVGKFFSLSTYMLLSRMVAKRAAWINQYVNKVIGAILILIGGIQLIVLLV